MSSLSSLTKAVTGLSAAQKGLQVTGHNISNANTKGYTRQQLLQSESAYLTIGNKGGYALQVGLGVTQDEIRQIRDDLADRRLRTENSVLCYYQKLNSTVSDIESVFDEPYGSTISEFLNNFWSQAQKLSTAPDGVEERQSFISSAKVLIDKVNVVADSLTTYQMKLDSDVKTSIKRINEILEGIKECNEKISMEVATGERANDYRDQRNLLLDELSQYGEISYYEESDHRVFVKFEGHTVVNKQFINKMEEGKARDDSPFSIPVWSDTQEKVFDLNEKVSFTAGNDSGSLKGLLVARGDQLFSKDTSWKDVALNDNFSVDEEGNTYIIPKVQMLMNQFAGTLVGMVNETFTGTGIGKYEGVDGVPVFIPINIPSEVKEITKTLEEAQKALELAVENGDKAEISDKREALKLVREEYDAAVKPYLIVGNVQVNPALLEGGGYNKLGTVSNEGVGTDQTSNIGDNSIVKKFLSAFGSTQVWNDKNSSSNAAPNQKNSTISDFFSELITDLGRQGAGYTAKASEKNTSVINIENERQAMGGVSTDEEFSSMLKYQYAYNASARMITMLDGMLDTVINKM